MSVTGREPRVSWSESISVASTDADRCRYRRSASVSSVLPGRPDLRRREGIRLGLSLTPTAFAESVLCYVGSSGTSTSSRRRHRSTIKYDGVGLRARRYFETFFVLPTSSVRHLSHVEARPPTNSSRRWYTAALKLAPRLDSVPETPTSPVFSDPLRHSVTSSWSADDNNNSGGNVVVRRCRSEQTASASDNETASFRSSVVVYV